MTPTSDAQDKTLAMTAGGLPPTVATTRYSVPAVDLSDEGLLKPAPRVSFNQLTVPSLGGIPLLAKLGQGGMGAVYFGVHTRLMLEVAVKVLPFQMANQDPTLVQRFFREAQIAAKVKSPHLVSVMDVNEEAGLFYLVMEFVDGRTGGEYCRETMAKENLAGLSEDIALDICIAATEGLIAAHAAGVIHRDIKPENILIPRDRVSGTFQFKQAKLSDLGLARNDQTVQSLTAAQNVMGTPGFMSPEQANDAKNAGKPADVFSMGATLYALLCGHAPFTGSTTLETVLNTIQKSHRPITIHRPDVSLEVSTLIDRCLSKRPQRRFEDAVALLQGLQACRGMLTNRLTKPIRARASGANATLVRPADDETLAMGAIGVGAGNANPNTKLNPYAAAAALEAPDPAYRPRPTRSSGSPVIALLFGALLLVGGGLWLAHQHQLVEDARAAEEARAALQAKADEEKLRLATGEQLQRAKAAEAEAARLKVQQAAEAAKFQRVQPQADNHVVVITPADIDPTARPGTSDARAEKIQRVQRALKAAVDAAHKAIDDQQKWADQVNALTVTRNEAVNNLNKLHIKVQEFRDALGPPPPPPPPGQRRPNGKPPPRDDGKDALEAQMHKMEEAELRGQEEVQQLEKKYMEAFNKYNAANAIAIDKLNERLKLESEVDALQKQ